MKIRIGDEGEDRPVELEEVYTTMGGGIHVIGHMAYGSAEKVYLLIDAETLAKIVSAASERRQANPLVKKN
ncbi:hypothetical protein [Methylobacterium sp. Leaf85]|uniref:hypothetical protein n=1 Tax=Methylobacterium sp. Leaf85 TaxID=1736241 RepID=UPI0006F71228|nr:hypothetical protein [Methylobacterium sp. Leaf85]KQO42508.1 hypothetical protein ASF08_12980 [Methylobacterium sp. Leaf85]